MTDLEIREDMAKAVDVMREGGVIACPTDTIWGLSCDATNESAVARLFEIKERPGSKSMISLAASVAMLENWVEALQDTYFYELDRSSSPLTVILDNSKGISPLLMAEDGSAAFRIPKLEYTADLCAMLGRPIVSTSANKSGQPGAATFSEINPNILDQVDYVCRFGRDLAPSAPSRIIKISGKGEVTVIRP